MTVLGEPVPSGKEQEVPTGQLVKQLSEQVSRLVRDELKLASVEMTGKAKTAAKGAGLFGGGGVLALYGGGCLVACAVPPMNKDTAGGGTTPQSAEAITADIERTRQELGETLEALAAKADVKARAQHRATEVAETLRGKARTTIEKARAGARSAKDKVAEHGPAAQATKGARVYSVTAVACAAGALLLAWLTMRQRRR